MNAAAFNTKVHSVAPAARAFRPGDVLDAKYRLEAVLGAGAMGQVWRARNIMLDSLVAIKIVLPTHGSHAMERLLTEARVEARLRHPNIVGVMDVRADAELSYVVMELLEGCTFADLMDQGPIPPTLAIRLLLPLIDGLCAAHKAGVVHRDIKPENVFIARGGSGRVCPKLLDFGIARSDESPVHDSRKQRVVMGTPGYMSPEQAWGDDAVDQRADVWALGIVLYEIISGRNAFSCSDYKGFLRALEESELEPLAGAHNAPLWQIIRRATSKACADRFPSSAAFGDALRQFLRERGVTEDLMDDSLPQHWATPGSVIDRAWRKQGCGDTETPLKAVINSECATHEVQRAARKPGARRASPDAHAAVSSRVREISRPAHQRRRGWQVASLALGAILGVTFSFARLHGKPTPTRDARVQLAPVAKQVAEPTRASVKPVQLPAVAPALLSAPRDTVATPRATDDDERVARKNKAATNKHDAATRAAAHASKEELRDDGTHRWKTRRAYANNSREWSNTQKRGAAQRDAADLGLKSPW